MGCKLTSNITKENCNYSVAGVKALYLLTSSMRHPKFFTHWLGQIEAVFPCVCL
jgi:hypothetical protein